jgi:HK97 family phage prohead protease
VTELRFDPDQPRAHDGKWTSGMPSVVAASSVALGGLSGSIESHPDGKVGFALGGGKASFDRKTGGSQVINALFKQNGVHDIAGPNGKPELRLAFGKFVDEDEEGLGGHAARLTFLKQDVSVDLSSTDVRKLNEQMEYTVGSQRVSALSGDVDVFLSDRKFGLRTKTGANEPVEMEFDAKHWRKLMDAHAVVQDGYDDGGDYGPVGADVTALTVKTPAGRFEISRSGPGDGATVTIAALGRDDFQIQHTLDLSDPFMDALNVAEEAASGIGFYVLSAHPAGVVTRLEQPPRPSGDARMTATAPTAQSRRAVQQMAQRSSDRSARYSRQFHVRAQLRAAGDNTTELDGYASVTGSPYQVRDWLGDYAETIERGAFAKTLRERDDVRLLLNHDGLPLARTSSGTMTLEEDGQGLHVLAGLDRRSSLTNDVAVAMERGDLTEMSFAFSVTRQEWNDDYSERFIRELKLFDVSVVTYPANPATTVKLRGAELEQLDDDELRELVARAQRRLAPRIDPTVLDALRLAVSLTE